MDVDLLLLLEVLAALRVLAEDAEHLSAHIGVILHVVYGHVKAAVKGDNGAALLGGG